MKGRSLTRFVFLSALVLLIAAPSVEAKPLIARGTWRSSDGRLGGTWKAKLYVAGQDLAGDIVLTGLAGLTHGRIAGSVHGEALDFGVLYKDSEVATFDGGLTPAGIAGNFTTPVGIAGHWEGHLVTAARRDAPALRRSRKGG